MLYRCSCKIFDPCCNHYRVTCIKIVSEYIVNIAICPAVKKMVIILFEPGGLLDEYAMLSCLKGRFFRSDLLIDIKIIEKETTINSIQSAQKIFQEAFLKVPGVLVTIRDRLSLSDMREEKCESIIMISLDPYYFLFDLFFKNKYVDYYELSRISLFSFFISLYTEKNSSLTDTVFLDMCTINRFIHPDYFLFQQYQGTSKDFYSARKIQYFWCDFLE